MRNDRKAPSTEVAFDSLPPALRRKYFSSLERLRLAQDGRNSYSSTPPRLSFSPAHQSGHPGPVISPSSLRGDSLFPSGVVLRGARLRKRRASAAHVPVADLSTSAWFASLSPAVQRKLFSPAEWSYYTRTGHRLDVSDAADETFRRRSSWHPNRFADAAEPRFSDEQTVVDCDEGQKEERADSAVDMCDYSTENMRWLEDAGDLDLRLDDYHEAIAETARRTATVSAGPKRPSRHHTSISSLSLHRPRRSTSSSQPYVEPTPPTPTLPVALRQPRAAVPFSLKPGSPPTATSSIDPQATHYQDPSARMKLRLYLASPQKFDEAVEFGFPSLEERRHKALARPMTSPGPRPDVSRPFIHDDTPSLSADEGDDGDESNALFDPRTPEDPVFHIPRPALTNRIDDHTGSRPRSARRPIDPYGRAAAVDREMTLHMTLTRPDLRSPEEVQSQRPKDVNAQPLERPALLPEGQSLSIWDTLPVEESKMKKFLRRLRLK